MMRRDGLEAARKSRRDNVEKERCKRRDRPEASRNRRRDNVEKERCKRCKRLPEEPSKELLPGILKDVTQQVIKELLPGILKDVTEQVIKTTLPWHTSHVLASVSHAWEQALRKREMAGARVRSHSGDTLIVINNTLPQKTNAIALYSLRDKACYQLPPTPYLEKGIPRRCSCITLDGKIYILGGLKPKRSILELASEEALQDVYVFDLAGQWGWKRCASMLEPRSHFGCGVIDGKIYVCGGTCYGSPVFGAELYDPKIDAWTSITPMKTLRVHHKVGTMGDQLFVYGGSFYDLQVKELIINNYQEPQEFQEFHSTHTAQHFEIYNPTQGTWKIRRHHFDELKQTLFMAEGKWYSMTKSAIYVLDLENDAKSLLHLCSYKIKRHMLHALDSPPLAVLAVDGHLLAIASWHSAGSPRRQTVGLLQCRGFGISGEPLVWQEVQCPLAFDSLRSPFMCLLRL